MALHSPGCRLLWDGWTFKLVCLVPKAFLCCQSVSVVSLYLLLLASLPKGCWSLGYLLLQIPLKPENQRLAFCSVTGGDPVRSASFAENKYLETPVF